jgi:hypothetical protein
VEETAATAATQQGFQSTAGAATNPPAFENFGLEIEDLFQPDADRATAVWIAVLMKGEQSSEESRCVPAGLLGGAEAEGDHP